MTTDEARTHREFCEANILTQLRALTSVTGLDICRVEVFLVAKASDDGDPRREAEAVRIELTV